MIYPLLALRGTIVFPNMVTPLEVGRELSIYALEAAMTGDKKLVLAAQKDASIVEPLPEDIYNVGTICEIKQLLKMPEGQIRVLMEGLQRVEIRYFIEDGNYFKVAVEPRESIVTHDMETEALRRSVLDFFEKYVRMSKKIPNEVISSVNSISDPDRFADAVAGQIASTIEERQPLLEELYTKKRLEMLLQLLSKELDLLELEKKIQLKVRKQMERTQREYYLREQMKAIQGELGDKDEKLSEVDEYKRKLAAAKLPKDAKAKVVHELHRFEKMPPMAAEAVVVRNYLDWMLSLPWSKTTKDRLDINRAEEILDRDHYGLTQVKQRILEYLAVRQLTKQLKGPILCLVGPPGVGKTSLARSVADSLGRKFVRISLGGIRDEAEIRGHRRTYVGALPGRIIQAMKAAGSRNPVFLLDEIDKLGMDFRGDPTSALLEALDPEQNHSFSDHYLEVPFDLSQVMFLTTANVLHQIPPPLRDRMEVIEIPGYTEHEKLEIAKRHLWPKQLVAHGLVADQVQISENALTKVISDYTREAGVRNLERSLAAVCRKIAAEIVRGGKTPVRVTVSSLHKYLGVPKYQHHMIDSEDRVGVATGLAFTAVGGEILSIEVTIVKGKGNITLTGKLGEVMRESAQTAISYIRSRTDQLNIDPDFHEKYDIHVHVPEGAIPKDGPSAGITIATAVVSALTGKPVRRDLAMTGEITLRGRVLPIGGVKEKLLAAHRSGITHVILPKDNQMHLEDIPEDVLRKMEIEFVDHMDNVLEIALVGNEGQTDDAKELDFVPTEQFDDPRQWIER
ncbi:MAG: endopeptidase La [Limnochordia bacterium]|jgi:ATP-dependent Lon protease|nr:endopeptidase La [Bacillota bacterium]HOB09191.1 endopeptidase La [Limnochordia bacterium]NLH32115.1 endopeptidase La [Bacillota bacterium]HPT93903.1 endopeptidase La [Limnochordia bacterium]HPZ30097.1 endopeptidase La [Limnochordia bacterium]